MSKKVIEYIPVELYAGRRQMGFSDFSTLLIARDVEGRVVAESYKQFNPKMTRRFYDSFLRCSEQKEGVVDLHCKGNVMSHQDDFHVDGYWGRKLIIERHNIYLRNLSPLERNFLSGQFGRFNKGSALQVRLVD